MARTEVNAGDIALLVVGLTATSERAKQQIEQGGTLGALKWSRKVHQR